ncbi:hypothetical protein [Microseira sp. BLCC-F43]|uniref:hypothetical protein n=1 Tax=Microseira sp. BLCC-F43 TaxID=3153602 RepID=UPI0035B8071A
MVSQGFFPQATTGHFRAIKAPLPSDDSNIVHHTESLPNSNDPQPDLSPQRETICQFFLNLVKQSSPDLVLSEFKNLFIQFVVVQTEPQKAFYKIIICRDEEEFKNTLTRTIYIILNNWIFRREYKPAQELIELLGNAPVNCCTKSQTLNHLSTWLDNFINSQEYQEIKVFVAKYDYQQKQHWKNHYTSYLLTSQYANSQNSLEQRQAAKVLSQQLQDKFKVDLAMYTAHSHPDAPHAQRTQNPTFLGDEALELIKKVVAKRSFFSYGNLANIFIQQTHRLKYKYFKKSLIKYLFFSVSNQGLVDNLRTKLTEKLEGIYQEYDEEVLNKPLLLKTCNRTIEWLTIPRNGEPSSLFIALASQGNPLTLAIILLKLILICPPTRTHLEVCMANLIRYYEDYSQEECHWVIKFLEITKIILTIFTENVQYNLVDMDQSKLNTGAPDELRIFSQQAERNKNSP